MDERANKLKIQLVFCTAYLHQTEKDNDKIKKVTATMEKCIQLKKKLANTSSN